MGIVQGLGEFLPISSSAHLILAPWLFHFPDPGLSFDVALHFGTLIAVVLFFWKDWIDIVVVGLTGRRGTALSGMNYGKNLLWLLIIATIPGAAFGYLFESEAETIFRSPLLIAATLVILGLVLYLVDRYHIHRKQLDQMTWLDSLWIGLSQAIAVVPGISRSGATITTGLFLGLNRESAARFSFLLSTPIIFGAAALKLPHLLKGGMDIFLLAGMLTAAISGYFAIKYLLKFIQRASYAIFFWYRLALALLVVVIYFLR
ncbi:MAG TPA: undecaprenyl-diphosphatase UppP [Candidatus Bathyarchaeia archaeon]|nr:undecaprenyl-diphosphatase UppP [Candidatus Bathyarchaeia archaeon]